MRCQPMGLGHVRQRLDQRAVHGVGDHGGRGDGGACQSTDANDSPQKVCRAFALCVLLGQANNGPRSALSRRFDHHDGDHPRLREVAEGTADPDARNGASQEQPNRCSIQGVMCLEGAENPLSHRRTLAHVSPSLPQDCGITRTEARRLTMNTKSDHMTLVHSNCTRPMLTGLRRYPTVPILCGPI